ncbi:MAG: hypothetical protein VYD99_06375, partial [Planctomycetota bacterium]|nr:hypothetical protein [Planctomycetota bacterium]
MSRPWMPGLLIGSVLVAMACLPGCTTVSGSGRSQVNLYSPEQDASIGQQAWAEVLSDPAVLRSGPAVERVKEVGDRI